MSLLQKIYRRGISQRASPKNDDVVPEKAPPCNIFLKFLPKYLLKSTKSNIFAAK